MPGAVIVYRLQLSAREKNYNLINSPTPTPTKVPTTLAPEPKTPEPPPAESPNVPTSPTSTSPTSTPTIKEIATETPEKLNADYSQLENLLKEGKWKEADQETLDVMLKGVPIESYGWLDNEFINNFPCSDLRTIDQLWVKYSSGRFGFSVQKRIWLEVGGKVDPETEEKLNDRLGWRKGGEWLSRDQMTFSTQGPVGHLPKIFSSVWRVNLLDYNSSLAQRAVTCRL